MQPFGRWKEVGEAIPIAICAAAASTLVDGLFNLHRERLARKDEEERRERKRQKKCRKQGKQVEVEHC